MKIVLQTRGFRQKRGNASEISFLPTTISWCVKVAGATGLSAHLLGSKETQKKNQRIVW